MELTTWNGSKVYPLSIDASGRLVIPVGTQLRDRIRRGSSPIALENEHGELLLTTDTELLRSIQASTRSAAVDVTDLGPELIDDQSPEFIHV